MSISSHQPWETTDLALFFSLYNVDLKLRMFILLLGINLYSCNALENVSTHSSVQVIQSSYGHHSL